MDKQQGLRATAQAYERTGDHAAALEAYSTLAGQVEGKSAAAVWMHIGDLQLRLGHPEAADSYARAAECYAREGLNNVALALFQRALRTQPERAQCLLRLGEISALLGYAREARLGYVEYAERCADADRESAVRALSDYLGRFPGDAAVARRLSELGGAGALPESGSIADSGTLPTLPDTEASGMRSSDLAPGAPDDLLLTGTSEPAGDLLGVQRLEGLEPTHADQDWADEVMEHAGPDAEPLPLLGAGMYDTGTPSPRDDQLVEPLPLLGTEPVEPAAERREPSPDPDRPVVGGGRAAARLVMTPAGEVEDGPSPHPAPRDRAAALQTALLDLVGQSRFGEAAEVAEQMVELRPGDRAVLQRWVELAFRAGERAGLVRAYLALARHLEAELETRSAREVFQRVLVLDPANEEARRALAPLSAPAPPAPEYVDLGTLLLDDEPAASTSTAPLPASSRRAEPAGGPPDSAGHLDLAFAFKEVGRLEDAITQLQSALRLGARPLPTLEVLGECYFERGDLTLAVSVLERAVRLPAEREGERLGVLYWLGRSHEALGESQQARSCYQRVLSVDPSFRDAASRLASLEAA